MEGSHTLPESELDEIYHFAVQLAKDAGKMLLDAAESRTGLSGRAEHVEKESAVDLVTKTDEEHVPFGGLGRLLTRSLTYNGQLWACDADTYPCKDVECFIRKSVLDRYPSHVFCGEESYSKGGSKDYLIPSKGPAWCVDPLDGTVNFIHLCPFYCVSIAFIWDGEPVVGAINAPFLRQLFTACRGKGAWLNEKVQLPLDRSPIPPMPESAPKGCVFSCEWGKDRRAALTANLHKKVSSFVHLASELGSWDDKGGHVHGVRSLGSATLDLAYVAMGSFDIWWEGGCWEWDVAAGICLLKEAGGLVTSANPPKDPATAPVTDAHLGGRLYLAIRPAGDSSTETGRQTQERTVREVWRRVVTLDYSRPGV